MVGVVVGGSAALIAASDPAGPAVGGAAAAFVPADGHADWVRVDGQSGPQQRESGRTVGASVLFELPEIARTAAVAAYTDEEMDLARHWSLTWRASDAGAEGAGDITELHSVTDAGVRLVLSLGPANSFIFQPGIVVLDHAVRRGASWAGEGEGWWVAAPAAGQRPEDSVIAIHYSARYAATEPRDSTLADLADDGCLQVDGEVELTNSADPGAGSILLEDATLWCPGRGAVASVSSVDGGAPVRTLPADAPAFAADEAGDASPAWPQEWAARSASVSLVDPLFGESAVALAPALEPVDLGGMIAVAEVNTGSVGLYVRSGARLERTALLHPGGDVTTLGAVDGLLLAATTQRRVVAYDARGMRRWSAPISDVIVAPPIAGAKGAVLLAGLDGRVRSLDVRTGREQWSTTVSGDALDHLVRSGDRVIALDRTGRIVALNLTDGTVEWSAEEENVDTLTATAEAVYVARDNGIIRLDAATGVQAWSSQVGTGADVVAVVADAVVVLSWSEVVAFDVEAGAELWRAIGADRGVTDGAALVLDGRGPTRVVGPAGEVIEELRIAPEGAGSARFLVGAADGVWIVDSISGAVWVGS